MSIELRKVCQAIGQCIAKRKSIDAMIRAVPGVVLLLVACASTPLSTARLNVDSLKREGKLAGLQECESSLDVSGADVLRWVEESQKISSSSVAIVYVGSDSIFAKADLVGNFSGVTTALEGSSGLRLAIPKEEFDDILRLARQVSTSDFKDPGVNHITCGFVVLQEGQRLIISAAASVDPSRMGGSDPSHLNALEVHFRRVFLGSNNKSQDKANETHKADDWIKRD